MSDYISQDLLVLILKTLPVKTLIRCRCVSKSWKQLIASKSLVLDHLAVQRPRILAQNDNLRSLLFDPQTLPLFHKLTPPISLKHRNRSFYGFTLSSLHGVNCVYNHANLLLLFNPSIRHHLTIPLPELPIFGSDDHFFYCGFWIDPPSSDFKVVIFHLETGEAVIFSSKERSWMEVEMGDNQSDSSPQVMVDGVAYWITCVDDDVLVPGDVVFFDFEHHKFGTLELPPHTLSGSLCKWQDVLSFVRYDVTFLHSGELWAMQNGSWVKMINFQLPFRGVNHVYCVLESCGRVLVSNGEDCLVVHDPKDGFVRLKTRLVEIDRGLFSLSYDFVESLVFPERNCISSD